MPLNTQIKRDGKSLKLRWSDFHVAAMVIAAAADSGQGPYQDMGAFVEEAADLMGRNGKIGISPGDSFQLASYPVIGMTPLNTGSYTLTRRFVFLDNANGEELELLPGDVLSMSRSMR